MAAAFDDARLDDAAALHAADPALRWLAESGARVRREANGAAEALTRLPVDLSPRAVVAAGEDARLLRAVLEPWCPVPMVAWPGTGLPGWAGPLDLAVVLDPSGDDQEARSTVQEATRRGCFLVTACPGGSSLAGYADHRDSVVLPTQTTDVLAAAVVMLQALHRLGAGPEVGSDDVASALDAVAVTCSPHRAIGDNPAKDLAISFAEDMPLIWGGSILAARAGRRISEAFRDATGRPALAGPVDRLLPLLRSVPPKDVFADPFADAMPTPDRPSLLLLDDGAEDPLVRERRGRLTHTAEDSAARVHHLTATEGPEMARYARLLLSGTYLATYLGVGLGP